MRRDLIATRESLPSHPDGALHEMEAAGRPHDPAWGDARRHGSEHRAAGTGRTGRNIGNFMNLAFSIERRQ